jgi:hypothetical protein
MTDDLGRPKLEIRPHDFQIGGFRSIAVRHGDNALEVIQVRQMVKDFGDVLLEQSVEQEAMFGS